MNARAFAKLLTLFFGANLVLNDAQALVYSSERVPGPYWLLPLAVAGVVGMLYVYASKMRLDESADFGVRLLEAMIKVFGLYMFVEGLFQIASATYLWVESGDLIAGYHHNLRSFLFGFIHLLLSYVFAMKTSAVIRVLNLDRVA
jgi:hypothetical protein